MGQRAERSVSGSGNPSIAAREKKPNLPSAMSGGKAGSCADLWLTQWPHLAREGGPEWMGNVL